MAEKKFSALDEAINATSRASLKHLAQLSGVPYSSLQYYQRIGKCLGQSALKIERVTGVHRSRLNPELYPPEDYGNS